MPRRRISDRLLVWEAPGAPGEASSNPASAATESADEPMSTDDGMRPDDIQPVEAYPSSSDKQMQDFDTAGISRDDDTIFGFGEEEEGNSDSNVESLFDQVNSLTQLAPMILIL
jgi:hypothetical protein